MRDNSSVSAMHMASRDDDEGKQGRTEVELDPGRGIVSHRQTSILVPCQCTQNPFCIPASLTQFRNRWPIVVVYTVEYLLEDFKIALSIPLRAVDR